MKYYIDYEQTTGEILGYLNELNVKQKQGKTIEVDFFKYNEWMAFNKIIIDGKNITFEKVDWRTDEEIEKQRISSINAKAQSLILEKYPLEKQSSANLGIYGEEYKTEMISFISNCITLSNEAIDNDTSFEDYRDMLDE